MRAYFGLWVGILGLVLSNGCAAAGAGRLPAPSGVGANAAASVEGSDRRLAAALLAEAILPAPESHLAVAREYARLGVLDAARSRVQRALARAPRLATAHELMARIWRDWGMPGEALGHAHRAVAYGPRSASSHNTLGTVLDALGRVTEARESYAAAVALDPSAGWALNNLCYLEFRLGHLEIARAHCESALAVSPALVAARNNLALTYAAADDMAGAGAAFLAAGNVAAGHYNVGIVYLAHRRYADAALAFERAIKARPAFTAAKQWAHDAHMRALTVDDRRP